MSIERDLARIASALEVIAQSLNPGVGVVVDGVEHVAQHPTLTKPPLTWFAAGNGCAVAVDESTDTSSRTGQTTWDWLGVTPPATRTRSKQPATLDAQAESKNGTLRDMPGAKRPGPEPGSRAGKPLRCGRCRREGRSRMNHSNRGIECQHEDWWDE